MKKLSFSKRFLFPLGFVIGVNMIAGLIYDGASTLDPGALRSILISIFGPLTFLSLWFFAFVGPPLAYFRGAVFWERLVIAFANPLIWVISVEVKVACQYCLAEMVYFFFLPWTFGIICVTCVEFSLSEFICRFVQAKKLQDPVKILHPGITVLFIAGLMGTYFGLIKGQEWVYFVVHHYQTNFF